MVDPAPHPSLRDFVQKMPKAELHIHLEGSLSPETLLQLARTHNQLDRLPSENLDDLRRWFTFRDFPHFMQIYLTISELLRTPDDFVLAIEAIGKDMAEQNILYREVTVTPFTHLNAQHKGLSVRDFLSGLETGRVHVRKQHGVEINWIFDIPRNASFTASADYDPFPAEQTLAYAIEGMDYGVVALGLGGDEVNAPPHPFAPVFARAKSAGLASVPHAGETAGPASIWEAITDLHADRIGHGVRAVEDPALLTLLVDKQIPLEVNLSSNVLLHIYPHHATHPLPELDRMGVAVTLGSDDPSLFGVDLVGEYLLLDTYYRYTKNELARIARNSFLFSLAAGPLKQKLLAHFDDWCSAELKR